MSQEKNDKLSSKPKKPKHRSPNFPSLNLEKALEKTKEIFESYKTSWVPERAAHEFWGNAAYGSQGLLCTAALKAYGLIQVDGSGKNRRISVSEPARRILLKDDNYDNLLKETALLPPLHRELWNHYEGFLPASDESFRKYLLIEKNFNEKSVDSFIAQFRSTIALTGLEKGDIFPPEDGNKNDVELPKDHTTPSTDKFKRLRTSMEELSQKSEFRELRFFLPSGDAYLFVPTSMDEDDFEILNTLIETHKKATMKAEAKRHKNTQKNENRIDE